MKFQRFLSPRNLMLLMLATITVLPLALQKAQADGEIQGGQMAPDIAFTTIGGRPMRLSSFRGRIVVLNFFATWCGYCRQELPYLESIYRRQQSQNLVMISLGAGHTTAEVATYARQNGLTYMFGADPDWRAASSYGSSGIPRTYVIDPSGRIIFAAVGFAPEEMGIINQAITQWKPYAVAQMKPRVRQQAKAKINPSPRLAPVVTTVAQRRRFKITNVKFPQMPKDVGQGAFLLDDSGVKKIK